jgi:hypothetical protein
VSVVAEYKEVRRGRGRARGRVRGRRI